MFIKLVAGILLINNALTVLETLLNFGTAIIADMQTSIQSSASSIDNPYIDEVNSMGSGFEDNINAAFMLIKLFFPYILNLIIQLVIMVVCFSRMMELVVRGAFAPIGMADIFAEGARANGVRYLRKYVSIALQGAVIVGIARTMNMLNLDSGSITSAIILGFATVMIIIKSQGLCDDLCGAK